MRFLGITAVAVLIYASIMTSSGVALGSADGVTAILRPNGTSDSHFRADINGNYYVRVLTYENNGGWAQFETNATLLVFIPSGEASVEHSESTDPVAAHVQVHVDAQDWVQVAAIPFHTSATAPTLVYIQGSDLADRAFGLPVSVIRVVTVLPDGQQINHNAAKNQLIQGGYFDAADLIDDVYSPALLT